MAAIYLPQFITDQRLRYLIDEISPEQRKSYRWLRQTLIDAGKYRPPHSNAGNSLSERYWSKISDLRSHVRDDICQFGKEIHGLAGETYQHLAKQYVTPTDRMIKNVVPGVSKTVVGVLNKVASTVAATANSNDTSPPPPATTTNTTITTTTTKQNLNESDIGYDILAVNFFFAMHTYYTGKHVLFLIKSFLPNAPANTATKTGFVWSIDFFYWTSAHVLPEI
ncbi:hypothetical protein DERF_002840 [Dermatophagoides farinae]|uniref:Uncharacterized protein n=1 Tax=Dermatophagoides farinae TaxID=6954 RepID=A0A922IDY3_DERFA|nr:hypothetical protein DERF_002840 [Dermatophagoides farinae]